jgi:hypothetical protein
MHFRLEGKGDKVRCIPVAQRLIHLSLTFLPCVAA